MIGQITIQDTLVVLSRLIGYDKKSATESYQSKGECNERND